MGSPHEEANSGPLAAAGRPRRRFFVLMAFVVLALDQLSKWLVVTYLRPGQSVPALPFLDLTYSINRGAAFGIWATGGKLLAAVAALCIVALMIWGARHAARSALVGWALASLVGGALGNLLDRIRLGHVVDFIDLHFWPVFNLADTGVVVGAVLLLVHSLRPCPSPSRKPACLCAEERER